MEKIEIPKDCLLCDSCNKQLSDENFIANDEATWREGWLFCKDCDISSIPLIMHISKGDNLNKTDLAKPIVMEMF